MLLVILLVMPVVMSLVVNEWMNNTRLICYNDDVSDDVSGNVSSTYNLVKMLVV